jgi:hypothetical protein
MQLAQRPGGAYALNATPHFPQRRVSAMARIAAFRCCFRQHVPKANSGECYKLRSKSVMRQEGSRANNERQLRSAICLFALGLSVKTKLNQVLLSRPQADKASLY